MRAILVAGQRKNRRAGGSEIRRRFCRQRCSVAVVQTQLPRGTHVDEKRSNACTNKRAAPALEVERVRRFVHKRADNVISAAVEVLRNNDNFVDALAALGRSWLPTQRREVTEDTTLAVRVRDW